MTTHQSRNLARCEARTVNPCDGRTYIERCGLRGEVQGDIGLVLCHQHRRRFLAGREIVPCFVDCTYATCVCPPRGVDVMRKHRPKRLRTPSEEEKP